MMEHSWRTFFKRIPRNWIVLLAIFLLCDLAAHLLRQSSHQFYVWIYFQSLGMSVILFFALDLIRRMLPSSLALVCRLLLSFLLAFVLIASLFVYSQFGEYVTFSKLQFVVHDPDYLQVFVRDALLNGKVVLLIGLWGAIFWLWGPVREADILRGRMKIALILLGLVAIYLFNLNQLRLYAGARHLTIDTSLAVAIKNLRGTTVGRLRESIHLPVTPYSPKVSCNVLVIINESFGKTALIGESNGDTPMPFLRNWIQRDSSQLILFDRAFTVASFTPLSVSSLVTGVPPYQPVQKLHTMPFLWDWAAAGGYQTLMVSAQSGHWARLDEYFTSPNLCTFISADNTDEPMTNDTGIDELVAMGRFCDELLKIPVGQPFCAIYNSNILHYPFHTVSRLRRIEPRFRSAYKNAAMILDVALETLYEALEKRGALDNTLIIITSDHGETDSPIHPQVHRLYSFYDEIMSIPFMVRVPSSLQIQYPEWFATLKANRNALVSNLDIVPTIATVLGADQIQTNRTLLDSLSGQSLIETVSEDRRLVTLNTNDLRQWEHEGFGIYWKTRRFVFSDIEGSQLFDIAVDPLQRHNLWPDSATGEDSAVVRSTIDSLLDLKRIWSGSEK